MIERHRLLSDQTPSAWERAVVEIRADPERRKLVFDAYYDDPLRDAAERYWCSEEWNAVRAFLPNARGLALDVGAGRGIASYALARDGFSVVALEPESSDIVGAGAIRALSLESALRIEVVENFSERLPFANQYFDVVFARAVLHHTNDLRSACSEFFRVLKRGGSLLAIREHVVSRPEDLPKFFSSHPLHGLYGGENAFVLDHYVDVLLSAGFELRRVLAPFESPINYAPHTLNTLKDEIAARAGKHLPGATPIMSLALRIPGVWSVARSLMKRVDNRPGRLYSFVARRP